VNAVGHIDTPLPAEMTWTGLAMGSTWNGTTCTSYCHGSTLNGGGTATSPVWTKVDGTQKTCTACHGNPPPAPHPANNQCTTCHADGGTGGTFVTPSQHIDGTVQVSQVHPAGYNAREQHGYDFDKGGSSTCATASCHGTALTGGNTGGPSCNSCHNGWQTNCTFCHGGTSNTTGAPPEGVMAQTAATDPAVGAHTKHVAATAMHAAWDCTMCHTKPSSALTPGHVDGNGGVVQAEVVYGSLNPGATFTTGTSTCTNLYCHGTGTGTGTAVWTDTTALTCTSCHGAPPPTGEHGRHSNYSCSTCHQATVASGSTTISTLAKHVNGIKEVQLSGGGAYNAQTKGCSGLAANCHGPKTW
jgi:predicted CxxxxCH...CXXCH cytochrome family protein